ncbi:cell division protein FtsN [Inhella inkyongensis]|uniref:Cell division protein FtsN n=1 Tax=Inhella inkyongensis TaxID=392593 RepID=A0A840S0A1_9BURK|nr:SPOR domain-containing protein [Inhella inkyongensis]MBB5202932.1 cell division protein FtsN [Inhella inkyongensis]
MTESKKPAGKAAAGGTSKQKGGFGLGLVVGLLLGLAIALGVALYVTKVPIPFVDKTPQRNAEMDAADANGAKTWDPNAALNVGKPRAAASGVVAAPPAPPVEKAVTPAASTPAPTPAVTAASGPAPAPTQAAQAASASRASGTDPFVYFVQAGAFTKPEEAEQQRARLGLQGFNAKVYERESSGRLVYRVRIGPFDAKADAETLHAQVQQAGMESAVVKAQR